MVAQAFVGRGGDCFLQLACCFLLALPCPVDGYGDAVAVLVQVARCLAREVLCGRTADAPVGDEQGACGCGFAVCYSQLCASCYCACERGEGCVVYPEAV